MEDNKSKGKADTKYDIGGPNHVRLECAGASLWLLWFRGGCCAEASAMWLRRCVRSVEAQLQLPCGTVLLGIAFTPSHSCPPLVAGTTSAVRTASCQAGGSLSLHDLGPAACDSQFATCTRGFHATAACCRAAG